MGRAGYIVACAALALSCGTGTYAAVADLGQEELRGSDRFVGPYEVPVALLVAGLLVTSLLGLIALIVLVRWRLLAGRDGVIVLAASAAAAVTGWGWRELTAEHAIEPRSDSVLVIGAVVLAWLALWIGIRASRRVPVIERNCPYCARPDSRAFGDVHIVSADEGGRTVLLQCPRCGCLHTGTADRPELAEPITEADARELFPSTW